MEAPQQIDPKGLADYLAVLTKAVFQSGMSWRVIEAKWDGFLAAFDGFDPHKVADLTPDDVDRLAEDARIVRNRAKIEATIQNAQMLLELDAQPDGFTGYLRSHGDFEALVRDLRGNFRWLGDTGAYYFLYVVREPVPSHEDWMKVHPLGTARRRA